MSDRVKQTATHRQCIKCGSWKHLHDFYPDKWTRDGRIKRNATCRECTRRVTDGYNQRVKEQRIAERITAPITTPHKPALPSMAKQYYSTLNVDKPRNDYAEIGFGERVR